MTNRELLKLFGMIAKINNEKKKINKKINKIDHKLFLLTLPSFGRTSGKIETELVKIKVIRLEAAKIEARISPLIRTVKDKLNNLLKALDGSDKKSDKIDELLDELDGADLDYETICDILEDDDENDDDEFDVISRELFKRLQSAKNEFGEDNGAEDGDNEFDDDYFSESPAKKEISDSTEGSDNDDNGDEDTRPALKFFRRSSEKK